MQVTSAGNLWPTLQSLADQAETSMQNGIPFTVSAPTADPTSGPQAGTTGAANLSGKFGFSLLEKAGDDTLFDPANPSAPNAGQAEFAAQLQNFLTLAQAGDRLSGPSTYQDSGSFTGDGGAYEIGWNTSLTFMPGEATSQAADTHV